MLSYSNAISAKNENKIILKVGNEIVTNYEIKNKIISTLVLANLEVDQLNINNQKARALESLVILKVKKIELSKHNIKSDEKSVQSYLNKISSNNIQEFKKKLLKNNIDYQLFLEEVDIQFKWQALIYKIYSKKIVIDNIIIEKELKDLIKLQSNIEEFKISEIEILLNNDESDTKRILETKNQIDLYGFENTAAKISISPSSTSKGDLGWINGKSLSKKIYTIIKNMNIGDVSQPINSQASVLFLKLVNKKISSVEDVNIEELKNNLINAKRNELFNLYSRSHLSIIKNSSLIEYQ